MKNIFTNTKDFPDSKNFALNQHKAEVLVINTIPGQYKEHQEVQTEMEDVNVKKQEILSANSEFLDENGFTPTYKTEKRSRWRILVCTPIFSGLSIATGVNIIFGLNIVLAIFTGILISVVSFFLALNDKVLENLPPVKKGYTYLLFLAIDAVVLIVGLFIGLNNGIPTEYMVIHILLCVFAVVLNYSMLKHSEKFYEDKVRTKIKEQFDKLKDLEERLKTRLDTLSKNIRSYISELGVLAVTIRGNFVSHNYDPSTIRMSQETRMVLNQFFGYDLFPIVADMILAPDFEWNRQQITRWNPDTSSIYPEVLPVFGPFSTRSRFVLDRATNGTQTISGALSDSNPTIEENRSDNSTRPQENNQPNNAEVNTIASVNQTAESENEL